MGGLTTAARHEGVALTAAARQVYRDSFREGHGCKLCPRWDMPADLSEAEVTRRAEALRKAHFGRLALRSSMARSRPRREQAR